MKENMMYKMIFSFIALLILFSGCIATEKQNTTFDKAEIWSGKMIGHLEGSLKFYVSQNTNQKSIQDISGKIEWKGKLTVLENHDGVLKCNINGHLKDGVLRAYISGHASSLTTLEEANVTGMFNGTLSENQGIGVWNMHLTSGDWKNRIEGEWFLNKGEILN
jgi:hypothetical protein